MQLTGGLYDSADADISWASPVSFKRLVVNDNQLSGVVTTEIGLGTAWEAVDLSRNQFTGALPDCA